MRARLVETSQVWVAAIAIPILLVAPAIWNGYPLLQWDTGGYLARWYEGYLVPSRSTVFGLYLHFGEGSSFWINLGIQALATFWILHLTLRVLGMSGAMAAARDFFIRAMGGKRMPATLARICPPVSFWNFSSAVAAEHQATHAPRPGAPLPR